MYSRTTVTDEPPDAWRRMEPVANLARLQDFYAEEDLPESILKPFEEGRRIRGRSGAGSDTPPGSFAPLRMD